MRARHRHFNPRDAGASLVYDSRRITGLSNDDPVSTWADISRNAYDATGTSTARPLYKTGVQGGNPALRFDGSNDQLSIPSGPSVSKTAGHEVIIVVKQISFATSFPMLVDFKSDETNNWQVGLSNNAAYDWIFFGGSASGTGYARLRFDATANTNTNVICVSYNGSGASTSGNYKLFVNGLNRLLTSAGNFSANSSGSSIGAEQNNNWNNADYYQLSLLNVQPSDALRKKITHAAAYSFKISCN